MDPESMLDGGDGDELPGIDISGVAGVSEIFATQSSGGVGGNIMGMAEILPSPPFSTPSSCSGSTIFPSGSGAGNSIPEGGDEEEEVEVTTKCLNCVRIAEDKSAMFQLLSSGVQGDAGSYHELLQKTLDENNELRQKKELLEDLCRNQSKVIDSLQKANLMVASTLRGGGGGGDGSASSNCAMADGRGGGENSNVAAGGGGNNAGEDTEQQEEEEEEGQQVRYLVDTEAFQNLEKKIGSLMSTCKREFKKLNNSNDMLEAEMGSLTEAFGQMWQAKDEASSIKRQRVTRAGSLTSSSGASEVGLSLPVVAGPSTSGSSCTPAQQSAQRTKKPKRAPRRVIENLKVQHGIDTSKVIGYYCWCGRSFQNRFNRREHIERHTTEAKFPCEHCPKKFFGMNYLRKHWWSAHHLLPVEAESYGCRRCGEIFITKKELIGHCRNVHKSWGNIERKPRTVQVTTALPKRKTVKGTPARKGKGNK